ASGERNRQFCRDSAYCFEKSGTAISGSSDVEYDQFVRALGVVAGGKRDGIAGIAQAHKVHAFHDALAVSVKARDDTVREAHAASLRKFCRTRAPESPLFSGSSSPAKMFCCSMTAANFVP